MTECNIKFSDSRDQHNTDSSVDESEVWIVAEWIWDCRTQDLTHVGQGEETHGLEDQEMVETQDAISHESVVWWPVRQVPENQSEISIVLCQPIRD